MRIPLLFIHRQPIGQPRLILQDFSYVSVQQGPQIAQEQSTGWPSKTNQGYHLEVSLLVEYGRQKPSVKKSPFLRLDNRSDVRANDISTLQVSRCLFNA